MNTTDYLTGTPAGTDAARAQEKLNSRLPSIEQLLTLLEEEQASASQAAVAEQDPIPVPEPVKKATPAQTNAQPSGKIEPSYPRARLSVDIPTADQLTRLKAEAAAYENNTIPAQARSASASETRRREKPQRRSGASIAIRVKKPAQSAKKVVKQKIVPAAAEREGEVNGTFEREVPTQKEAVFKEGDTLPTLSQLQAFLKDIENAPKVAGEQSNVDRIPAVTFRANNKYAPYFEEERQQTQREETPKQTVDRLEAFLRESAAAAPSQRQEMPKPETNDRLLDRLPDLPTLEQLKAMQVTEAAFGDVMFQERLRELRRGADVQQKDAPAASEEASTAEPQTAAPRNRVHYIPYEDFEDFSTDPAPVEEKAKMPQKSKEAPQAMIPEPEWIESFASKKKGDSELFFVKRKPRKEKRINNGTTRLPYLISSLRRIS